MPYVLLVIGLLTMCVPDDASFWRFAAQGAFGLAMFVTGIVMLLEKDEK